MNAFALLETELPMWETAGAVLVLSLAITLVWLYYVYR